MSVVFRVTISASWTTGFESWSISLPGATWTKIADDGQDDERERDGDREEEQGGEQRSRLAAVRYAKSARRTDDALAEAAGNRWASSFAWPGLPAPA